VANLAIVVLSWNTRELLEKCLRTLYEVSGGMEIEILVIDNGSLDGSQQMVREKFPQARLVVNEKNLGFAGGNNLGIKLTTTPFILLLNSDAFVTDGALELLLAIMKEHPKAGIVGAHLLNRDGSFQASHTHFPGLWQEFLILTGLGRLWHGKFYPSRGAEVEKGPQIVDYVEGACLLVRREAFEQVGGLSEDFFMYAEEVDWCYAMRQAGWEVWYQPEARIVHYGGASSNNRRTSREGDLYRSRVIFFKKNYGSLKAFFLKWMIVSTVAIKNIYHGVLSSLSGGKKGRPIIRLGELMEKMRGV